MGTVRLKLMLLFRLLLICVFTLLKSEYKNGIFIPISIGDTILIGRFKNKKSTVKTIGKDEHGMPTINGKRVVNFRIPPKEDKK